MALNSVESLFFIEQGFNIWNVDKTKKPCKLSTSNTTIGISGWQNFTESDFINLHVDYTNNIGFLSGYQFKSKKYILVLDFDIYSNNVKNEYISKLYDKFFQIELTFLLLIL